jgi:hypothetical protein
VALVFYCLDVLLKRKGKILKLKVDAVFLLKHFLKLYEGVTGERFQNFAFLTIKGYLLLTEVFFKDD